MGQSGRLVIYVVVGLHRTGTSMMIQSLHYGSDGKLPVLKSEAMEKRIRSRQVDPSYNPNPNGYWNHPLEEEVGADELTSRWTHKHDGKMFKLLPEEMVFARPAEYMVVWMERNTEEMNQSYKKSFGGWYSDFQIEEAKLFAELVANRKDVASFTLLNYNEVIKDPLPHYQKLKEADWPIDPEKAAKYVDPKLYRNRLK